MLPSALTHDLREARLRLAVCTAVKQGDQARDRPHEHRDLHRPGPLGDKAGREEDADADDRADDDTGGVDSPENAGWGMRLWAAGHGSQLSRLGASAAGPEDGHVLEDDLLAVDLEEIDRSAGGLGIGAEDDIHHFHSVKYRGVQRRAFSTPRFSDFGLWYKIIEEPGV